jgi:hypothetical protein
MNSVHLGPIDTDMIAFRTPEQSQAIFNSNPNNPASAAGGLGGESALEMLASLW